MMFRNLIAALTSLLLACPLRAQAAWTETILHVFTNKHDGGMPSGALVTDAAGNLYGTTAAGGKTGNGIIYELSPPAPGASHWRETILHDFNGADGATPSAGLVGDRQGNFYGTTYAGGAQGNGVIFELSPPAAGQSHWTTIVLHDFTASDGTGSVAELIRDSAGNLYGTTGSDGAYGFGTVFRLAPPAPGATTWTLAVLRAFRVGNGGFPQGPLIADAAGNLYGTSYGADHPHASPSVFKLTPPTKQNPRAAQGFWTETILNRYGGFGNRNGLPSGNLAMDAHGNLYGAGANGGVQNAGMLFQLTPPTDGATKWKNTLLYSFNDSTGAIPFSGVIIDQAGNLYSTTSEGGYANSGAVFQLTPPAGGQTAWAASTLHAFGHDQDGRYPCGALLRDAAGTLYGTTRYGGAGNAGTAFRLSP